MTDWDTEWTTYKIGRAIRTVEDTIGQNNGGGWSFSIPESFGESERIVLLQLVNQQLRDPDVIFSLNSRKNRICIKRESSHMRIQEAINRGRDLYNNVIEKVREAS